MRCRGLCPRLTCQLLVRVDMAQTPAGEVATGVEVLRLAAARPGAQQGAEASLASHEAQHQVQRRVTSDAILRKGGRVLQLLPAVHKALLRAWNSCNDMPALSVRLHE